MTGSDPQRVRQDPSVPFRDTFADEPPPPPWSHVIRPGPDGRAARAYRFREAPLGLLRVVLVAVFRRLPIGATDILIKIVAPLVAWSNRKRLFVRRMLFNIETLRSARNGDDITQGELLAAWWHNAARTYGEYATLERLRPAGRVSVTGWTEMPDALKGRQMIFVGTHLGSFELAFEMLRNGLERNVVGTWQPEPSRHTNRLLIAMRQRYGAWGFPPGQRSARHIHKLIVEEGWDMYPHVDEVRDRQVHIPAFGRALPTRGNAVTAVKLALKTGAPIVPVYLLRRPADSYLLVIRPPLAFDRNGSDAVAAGVAAIDAVFDSIVRDHIDQWYMLPELRLPGFHVHSPQ